MAVVVTAPNASAWEQPLRKGGAWFVPINVGVGPGVTWFPGVLSDTPYTSLSFDAFGIIDPRIVAHYVNRFRHKVPPKYAKCVEVVNTATPWHMKAGPAKYIPVSLVISPENPLTGAGRSALGVQTDPLFFDFGLGQGGTDEPLYMKLFIGLPTLSYHYVTHPELKGAAHIVGLGGRLKWQLTWQPHDRVAVTLQWLSVLQVTNAYETANKHDEVALGVGDSSFVLWDENHERAWHIGTFAVLFNWRFPFYINPGL